MEVLAQIDDHLHVREGFCHPDWSAIAELIEAALPEAKWNDAWETVARAWVGRLRESLGREYRVHESPNFLILTEAPARVLQDITKTCETSLKILRENLPEIALDEGFGKHVVLMFSRLKDYYGYILHFYPDGEHPGSGGCYLEGDGYRHVAMPTVDYSGYRAVLAHELTHASLGHLPMPLWLNEALAMRMERVICGENNFRLDREVYDKHTGHWNSETLQLFWSGHSWRIPGDSSDLSYSLAQILWLKIEAELNAPRDAVLEFISSAHVDDAGESAFQSIFELSLGDLIMDFLGEGDWAPRPECWAGESSSESGWEPRKARITRRAKTFSNDHCPPAGRGARLSGLNKFSCVSWLSPFHCPFLG